MNDKVDYNKKMIGQKVEVIENGFAWIGEVKETIDDHWLEMSQIETLL